MNENSRRAYMVFLFLLYVLINVHLFSQDAPPQEDTAHKERIAKLNSTLYEIKFNEEKWGLEDGLNKVGRALFEDPERVKEAKDERYYKNLTTVFNGDWKKWIKKEEKIVEEKKDQKDSNKDNKTSSILEDKDLEDDNQFRTLMNSSDTGYLTLQLRSRKTKYDEHLDKELNFISGYLTLYTDIALSYYETFLIEGFHAVNNGSAFLHGYLEPFNYNPKNVLRLLNNNNTFEKARSFYNSSYIDRLEVFEDLISGEEVIAGNRTCYLQMLLQIDAFDENITKEQIAELEEELDKPQGLPTIDPIPYTNQFIIHSPNCPELTLTNKDVIGVKPAVIHTKEKYYGILSTISGIIGILLLNNQMEYTSTASMVSKLSYFSFVFDTIIDGYFCLIHLTVAILLGPMRELFFASAFFYFVTVAFFELRYLQLILKVQRPESSTLRRYQEAGYINLHFYILILLGMFIIYQTLLSRGLFQQILLRGLIFLFYSFWVPQIYRNVTQGTSQGLTHSFIIGKTILKLMIPVYVFGYPYNVLNVRDATETSYPWIYFLVGYTLLQVLVLLMQDWFGPRFFTPKFLFPATHNYHEALKIDTDEEAAIDPSKLDCSICMLPLLSDVESRSNSFSGEMNQPLLHNQDGHLNKNMLDKLKHSRNIMTTPCMHRFHKNCLEQWMRIKLECPVCRTILPPI